MLKSRFNFRRDLDELLVSLSSTAEYLPEPQSLPPLEYTVHNDFDSVISQYQGLDKLILEQLKPQIKNKSILIPYQYEKLLMNAANNLHRLGQQPNNSVCGYCGKMLDAEVLQIVQIHSKKDY